MPNITPFKPRNAIFAKWDGDTVEALNEYQEYGLMPPFTCPNREQPGHILIKDDRELGVLLATNDGWVCKAENCAYTQNWAWPFMADVTYFAVGDDAW